MITHMLKIIWNRKQSYLFVFLEILFTFLVLTLISVSGLYYYHKFVQPMGFSIENVWNIEVLDPGNIDEGGSEKRIETLKQCMNTLKGMDEVISVGLISHRYSNILSNSYRALKYKTRTAGPAVWFAMDDGAVDVLDIDVIQGRWFDKSDDAAGIAPTIINNKYKEELFPEEDPIGKIVKDYVSMNSPKFRVIGVVSDFRHYGPFDGLNPVVVSRQHVNDGLMAFWTQLIVKTTPGLGPGFKAKLIDRLQPINRSYSISISNYEELNEKHIRQQMGRIYSVAVISVSMVVMAVLGLIGVLWQNVRRRIQEIGLRRAKGATLIQIFQQIAGEFLIVSTFAIALGLFLIMQFQYFDVLSFIPDKIYYLGMAISVGIIYILTILITIYPSMSAARIQPAQALHYE